MKLTRQPKRALWIVGVCLAVYGITACSQVSPVSRTERIQMFQNDINAGDWGSLYKHVHPDGARTTVRPTEYWVGGGGQGVFTEPVAFSFGSISSGGSTRTVSVSSANADNTEWNGTWEYTMKEDDPDVWYILRLRHIGSGDYIIP